MAEETNELRAQYPNLPAQLVIAARVKTTEVVVSALICKRKHEANHHKKVARCNKQGKEIKPLNMRILAQCRSGRCLSCEREVSSFLEHAPSGGSPVKRPIVSVLGQETSLRLKLDGHLTFSHLSCS